MRDLINRILVWLLSIKQDKWLHFIGGLLITQVVMLLPMTIVGKAIAGLVASFIVELCKETLLDANLDWKDVMFTMIGAGFGALIIVVTLLLV